MCHDASVVMPVVQSLQSCFRIGSTTDYIQTTPLPLTHERHALHTYPLHQVLSGLAYLHQQGVVHRDIKGANILTNREGLVKLADFGVAAKLSGAEDAQDKLDVVGTTYWMAPEVRRRVWKTDG